MASLVQRGVFAAFALTIATIPRINADEQPLPPPSQQATEAIRLLTSKDPYQQEKGFLLLEALREPATIPTIKPYLTSRSPDLRAYSVRALAAIEGAAVVPVLLQQLRTDAQPKVRRAALLGLEPLKSNDFAVLPAFIKALRDRDAEVRMTAVDIVSRIDDPRAREAILMRYKKERNRDVRRVLEAALKRVATS